MRGYALTKPRSAGAQPLGKQQRGLEGLRADPQPRPGSDRPPNGGHAGLQPPFPAVTPSYCRRTRKQLRHISYLIANILWLRGHKLRASSYIEL